MTTAFGHPTLADKAVAEVWESAIETKAEMWTRLSPEQQRMVQARIEWVHNDGNVQRQGET